MMNNTPAKSFRDLIVWQKAHQFVLDIYKLSSLFPAEERFGLTSQIRRAAISIAANIAEGFKKKGQKDKARFYNISQSSLEEVRYYLILANDLNFVDTSMLSQQIEEIARMLNSYIKTILSSKF